MAKLQPYPKPAKRPLSVYAFDPSLGRRLSNHMTIPVAYEKLEPGPIGRKIAVVDYDASNDRWYQPVDLDDPDLLIAGGLVPMESDPRFHQQMVYAVASATIQRFEAALGREISWRPRKGTRLTVPFRDVLRIFPHAFQQDNAYYDENLLALLFGYFSADPLDAGESLPGQTVFTCLSHDVVAHETTHAVLDNIRPFFLESTSADTPAFHEGFADIVALFQHFSLKDAIYETIRRTGGLIHRSSLDPVIEKSGGAAPIGAELKEDNPLVDLARQFGEAIGSRKALRSALGSPPRPKLMESVLEPHDRGAILVAAIFDAYFTIYYQRIEDLMRLARAAGMATTGDLHPDIAARLTEEAMKTATHFLNICIRAVDYCPPVDVQFGEYLRAMITADANLVTEDPHGYRGALIAAFRRRGIYPEGVTSLSEESLRWLGPGDFGQALPPCAGLQFDLLRNLDRHDTQAHNRNRQMIVQNAVLLHRYATRHAPALGLSRRRGVKIAVPSAYPIHRVSPNGRLVVEFVVSFMQQRMEPVDPKSPASPKFAFRGGSTVIFNHDGTVRYVIRKSIDSTARLARQREYQDYLEDTAAAAPFRAPGGARTLPLSAIHRGLC